MAENGKRNGLESKHSFNIAIFESYYFESSSDG